MMIMKLEHSPRFVIAPDIVAGNVFIGSEIPTNPPIPDGIIISAIKNDQIEGLTFGKFTIKKVINLRPGIDVLDEHDPFKGLIIANVECDKQEHDRAPTFAGDWYGFSDRKILIINNSGVRWLFAYNDSLFRIRTWG